MRVRFSLEARADLDRHLGYIKERNPREARRVRASIYAAAKRAALFPESGRRADDPMEQPSAVPGTREIVLTDYPYVMPYRVEQNTLIILRVFHAAQDR